VALITSGEHYGAVLNGAFDYRRYLDTLAADGLNFTRLFGGSYIEVPGQSFGIRRNDLAPEAGRFIAPWARSGDKFDLDRWNPEYFTRYRDFLAEAGKRGIVVEVTLFSSQYQEAQWKVSPFNPANNANGIDAIEWKEINTLRNGKLLSWQEKYVRKLVHEANDFDNVIFEIQNEPWSDRGTLASVVTAPKPAAATNAARSPYPGEANYYSSAIAPRHSTLRQEIECHPTREKPVHPENSPAWQTSNHPAAAGQYEHPPPKPPRQSKSQQASAFLEGQHSPAKARGTGPIAPAPTRTVATHKNKNAHSPASANRKHTPHSHRRSASPNSDKAAPGARATDQTRYQNQD
jgi:hypothetical protein